MGTDAVGCGRDTEDKKRAEQESAPYRQCESVQVGSAAGVQGWRKRVVKGSGWGQYGARSRESEN